MSAASLYLPAPSTDRMSQSSSTSSTSPETTTGIVALSRRPGSWPYDQRIPPVHIGLGFDRDGGARGP
eukprot:1009563-Prymnesium_polylepis.1